MHIDDWHEMAVDESAENLIAFNYEYIVNGAHIGSFRNGSSVEVLKRFEHFLKHRARTSAKKILKDFAQRDRRSRGADCAAYAGVQVNGINSFRALKTAHFFLDHRSHVLNYGDIKLAELTIAIDQAVAEQAQPYKRRPAGNFKAETKRQIDRSLKKAIDNARSRSAEADARAARSGSVRSRTATSGGSKVGFADDPFWITSKKALQDELGKLGESAGPLERSGFAAGLKCALGLHSGYPSERAPDQSFADSPAPPDEPISPMSRFRVLFLLDVELSPSVSAPPTQPNIFSEGYENLFVARPGPSDMDTSGEDSMRGRTVRLRNVRRHSHGDECMCGAPGLPEAVMPTQLAIEEAGKGKDAIGSECLVAFADDLIYDLPDCEMIRNKNAI